MILLKLILVYRYNKTFWGCGSLCLGQKLKSLRRERNITQENLANALNVSVQSINNWENNKTLPDTDNLIKLSRFYDFDFIELLDGNGRLKSSYVGNINLQERNIMSKNNLSLVISIILVVASFVMLLLFIFKEFDFYLLLIPVSVFICSLITLFADLKNRKR
ncbi:helix-turn-helix domain-containing protein [Staphylococcus aureus]|uniref:helix-turn-helix domain-containing protein n=1 Tax=Staphylococcus aureus TaxID=1280 RepID=UPI00208FE227|nr:helix-turn-helix transcriptional regulator [Staphylococcus aureus]UXS95216.1 helix-turn-helix domain-containing protein [Staphylococcus aureus]